MRFLNPIAPVKVVFSIVISLLAIFFFTQGSMFGLILLFVGARLALREGAELDVFQKRYRIIYSLWAVSTGKWKPLPRIEYVSVFKTIKKTRARVITAEAKTGSVVYRLNLFHSTNKHITVYEGPTKKDAMHKAEGIAKALEIEVYDATKEDQ